MSMPENVVVLVCSMNEHKRRLARRERVAVANWFHAVVVEVKTVHIENTVRYNGLPDVLAALDDCSINWHDDHFWQEKKIVLLLPDDSFLSAILLTLIISTCSRAHCKLPVILRTSVHGVEMCSLQHIVERQGGPYGGDDTNIPTK